MKVEEKSGKSWLKTQHSENEDHGIRSHHFLANRWGNNENSDRLYFMAAVTICGDFGAPKNKVCHCFHCFTIYLPGLDAMILVF